MDLQLVWYQEGCANFQVDFWHSTERICKKMKEWCSGTNTKLLRTNARQSKMTNKSSDDQPTADHTISFTRRPVLFDPGTRQLSRNNNQTHRTQKNDPEPSAHWPALGGTENISRMNVCSHSAHTLPHSQVHHPEKLQVWQCFDDGTTRYGDHQIEASTCTSSLTLYPGAMCNKKGVHRRGTLLQNSKWWLKFKCWKQLAVDKETTYPELASLGRSKFVAGGRWSE